MDAKGEIFASGRFKCAECQYKYFSTKKNYAGVVALMADISKTAGKVVQEYYFATQGASRMNVPKSLKPKPKKTSKMNLIILIAHQ